MKTNKSYTKRLKVTRNGKILSRKAGQNHFNSKDSGRQRVAKRRVTKLNLNKKAIKRFLTQR